MTRKKRVITFGELMLRLAAPRTERLLQSPQLEATFGGSEANVAIGLSFFGIPDFSRHSIAGPECAL